MPILHRFVPALGFRALTPLYDRLIALALDEATLKRRLVEQARIETGMRVLDLGCGTGTLALLIKQMHPTARVIGVDVDPEVLAIAQRKAEHAGVEVEWLEAGADGANIADGSLDRVLSTLMLHHLALDEKQRALEAVRRWLKPGGELHIADFGAPQDTLMWVASLLVRTLDGADRVRDQLEGHLSEHVRTAGFTQVVQTHRARTAFGTLEFLRAV